MKFTPLVFLSLVFFTSIAKAVENPIFGYTHLLSSPFTLPAGRFVVGTSAGVGVTDFLELDTNLISDLFQIYNATARVSLLDFPGFAMGLSLGYQNVNLNNLDPSNPSLQVNSWMPGGVIGIEVAPLVALFLGGNLFYTNTGVSNQNLVTSGYLQGGQIESDISWAYNPHKNTVGNVLSGGVSYNSTFNFYGIGLSHHWRHFHIGFHYYPTASNLKIMPIFSAGTSIDL